MIEASGSACVHDLADEKIPAGHEVERDTILIGRDAAIRAVLEDLLAVEIEHESVI